MAFPMKIHCPTCNRSSDEARFIGDFCEFCVADKLKKRIAGTVEMHRCNRCSNIQVKGQYIPLGNFALSTLINSELRMHDCTAKVTAYSNGVTQVEFTCEVGDDKVKFEKPIDIKAVNKTCTRCYRISSGYYEAMVQLRGDAAKVEKTAERLANFIQKKGAFISKMGHVKTGGIDMYISDKGLTDQFFAIRELHPKRSYKIAGIKEGKPVYRNTYALHL
jgi:NMD protein affecting ribosome stability and mRNA decay